MYIRTIKRRRRRRRRRRRELHVDGRRMPKAKSTQHNRVF
jgi:hypothetical protein